MLITLLYKNFYRDKMIFLFINNKRIYNVNNMLKK